MTQNAIVYKCLPNGLAEVVVTRATACGGNCPSCEACVFQNQLTTAARNRIGAKPGQRVLIESKSSKVYGAILLVYILPIVLAVLGYFLAYSAGAGEGQCILATFAGIVLGAVIVVLSQRNKRQEDQISFDIIEFDE